MMCIKMHGCFQLVDGQSYKHFALFQQLMLFCFFCIGSTVYFIIFFQLFALFTLVM